MYITNKNNIITEDKTLFCITKKVSKSGAILLLCIILLLLECIH